MSRPVIEVRQIGEIDHGYEILPKYATPGSAGLDLRAVLTSKNTALYPGRSLTVRTGLAISINDPGLAMLIIPRSGFGMRGLVIANLIGLVDSDYQGEIIMKLWNRGDDVISINNGDRVAQALFVRVEQPLLQMVDGFSTTTARGESGFGSTGAA